MTSLDLGYDMCAARNPGGEPPWFPYDLPADVSRDALRTMSAVQLVTYLHDAAIVATRAMQEDEWPIVDHDTYEALVDIRDRLEAEVHRRLLEVEHQAEREQRLLDRVATERLRAARAAQQRGEAAAS